MGKTLGDYNIEKSSSYDIKNIKWTQKNSVTEKLKNIKKKTKKTSPTNKIYSKKPKIIKSPVEKIFKVKEISDTKKLKNNKKANKRFQNFSSSKSKIGPGFERKAR
ncbi:MAG TPA: hypothetical protein VMW55_07825 [Nitrosopumilaceae archaeon]|jgi:hypothetical protein|nr:hypothetical protein [Nitrosopumilaceae archaeon]